MTPLILNSISIQVSHRGRLNCRALKYTLRQRWRITTVGARNLFREV